MAIDEIYGICTAHSIYVNLGKAPPLIAQIFTVCVWRGISTHYLLIFLFHLAKICDGRDAGRCAVRVLEPSEFL